LTTKGAKTGRTRRTPAGHALDGQNVIFVGSNGGSRHDPAWVHNVRANPDVEVLRKGGHRGHYRAEVVPPGPERDRLWKLALEVFPGFDAYELRTGGRILPVVKCTPA
jgi:deazaflavin-dependent oxidoreductase (nitroreductase family)